MDLNDGICFLLSLCAIILQTKGATQNDPQTSLVTERLKSGTMGQEVVIECSFLGTKPWFLMQWKKWDQNGTAVTLVTLQRPLKESDPLTPVWSDGQTSRRGTSARQKNNTVYFNLRVNPFSCRDVGIYECSVIDGSQQYRSITNLTIQASPENPKIHLDILIVEANYSFTLECEAKVGLPPRDIIWYRKLPSARSFQRVTDGTEAEILRSSSCVPHIKQTLTDSITESGSGTMYRCQIQGTNLRDEIEVRLPEKIVTEAPYEVKSCEGERCNNVIAEGQSDNGATSLKFHCVFAMVQVIGMRLVFLR